MNLHLSKRGVILTAAAATFAIWLLFWGLIQGWYPALQRNLLLRALNQSLPFAVELDAVKGALVDELVLVGLVLEAKPEHVGNPALRGLELLAADRVRLDLDLTRLFEERLVIVQSLEASGVSLQIDRSGIQPDDSSSAANAKPESPKVQSLRLKIERVQLRELTIAARWQNELGPGHFTARGSLSTRDLSWPDVSANGEASATPLRFSADLQLVDGVLGPLELSSGRAKLNGTRDVIHVEFDAATARARNLGLFHSSGKVSFQLAGESPAIADVDARISFSQLDLAGLEALGVSVGALPQTRLNGELLVGLTRNPETGATPATPNPQQLRFELRLDPSHLESIAIDSGHLRFDYQTQTQQWQLSKAAIFSRGSEVEASGSGTLRSLDAFRLSATGLPLEVIAEALGLELELTGKLDLAAELSGPIRDPVGKLNLRGSVRASERPAVDFSLDLALAGDHRYRIEKLELVTGEPSSLQLASASTLTSTPEIYRQEDTWAVSNLNLRGPSGGLNLKLAQSDGRRHRIKLELRSLDLGPISQFFEFESTLAGTLSGPLAVVRDSKQTAVDADLIWQMPRYASFAADRVRLVAQTGESSIAIESHVEWGSTSPLRITAELPRGRVDGGLATLASHPEFAISVALNDLPASDLEFLLPFGEIAGTLSGQFTATGSSAGPQVTGSASWTDARFGSALADRVSLNSRTESGTLLLELTISDQGLGGVTANATLDLAGWLEDPASVLRNPANRASLRSQGVDLAWLVPPASARRLGRITQVDGKATGQLSVEGSANGPRITGELEIDDARIHLALLPQEIGPIDARLIFTNSEIRIESMEIRSKKGPAIVTGRYRWQLQAPGELQLGVEFKNFSLTHFPNLEARVNGDLQLAGSLNALQATGNLVFGRMRIALPAPDDPLFREVRILGLEGDNAEIEGSFGKARPSAYQRMRADIGIRVRRGARIVERGADLEAEGLFRLRKKPMSPTLLQGNLRTSGGTYTFLGRKFEVDEGTAFFEERTPPDPELHLVATRRAGNVTVGVEVTGRWSDLQSRLISTPAMDDTEILSYLVFDKPSDEIGRGDDAELNAAAAQLAGNLALSQLSRAVSEDLPINEISMDVNEDMSVASVGVETNVGEDIILRYDRALQNGTGDRFSVEWRFWKNLSLRSEYENGGTSGIDIFWSYDY